MARTLYGRTTATLTGDRELMRLLDALPDRVYRRVVRGAVAKGARPIVRTAKTKAPKASRKKVAGQIVGPTGLLKKSLGHVVRTYKTRGIVSAIIGARRGFRTMINGRPRDPANYAHLVEHGHRVVRGGAVARLDGRKSSKPETGTVVGFVEPRPYLRPAFEAHERSTVSQMTRDLRAGIEREAVKLAKKNKRAAQ